MKSSRHFPRLAVTLTALAAQACCFQAAAQNNQQLERVEVTGTNIKRISRETESPVDVITAKDIQASGARTALEVLKMVPSIGNDGYNDTATQNGFSRGVSTVSLRNQTATSTLVLINGRRMAPSAYANPNNGTTTLYDLNSIPVSAIERIEVLKDGASAVYGSDAIAGVVNFITRKDYQGLQVKLLAGANDAREYERQTVSATLGFGDFARQGYNVFIGLDYTHKGRSMVGDSTDEDIHAADYRAINLRRNPYGSFLYNNQPWFIRENGTTGSRSFPQTAAVPATNTVNTANCADSEKIVGETARYNITTNHLLGRTFCNYNLDQFAEMQSPGDDLNLLTRGTLKLGESMEGFAEFMYSRSERQYLGAPRTISGLTVANNFNGTGLAASFQPILEIGHPDNPFTNARAAVQLRFPTAPGGFDLTNTGARALVGVRGTAGADIDWESAVLWNKSDRDEYYYGFLRLPVLRQMLGPAFGGTNRSLASISADPDLSRPLLNSGSAEVLQWDAKASTTIGKLAGGDVALAAGIEIRRESIDIKADPENLAGNVLGLANTAVKGDRVVKSAFVEVVAPVLKGLELNLAGRVDKYPTLKTNFVPKIGVKWQAADTLAFRGSYSEGFRAPSVSQVSPGGAQFFLNGLVDPVRCNTEATPPVPKPGGETADCNKSVAGVGGGNPTLKPENSYNTSMGLLFSPTAGVDLVLGYWKIRKNNEVALTDGQSVIDHPEAYPAGSLVRDTNPNLLLNGQAGTGPLLTVSTPWVNQGTTMTSGIDFEARVAATVMDGVRWSNSLTGQYTLKYERIEHPGYARNNLVGTRGGLADWSTSAPDVPRLKMRFTSSLESGSHTLTGAANYVSGLSFIRRMDGTNLPEAGITPLYYSGTSCQYGGALNDQNLFSRAVLGVAPTATNGRDLYINRYPGCNMAKWVTFDVGYTYSGFKNLTLSLNIQNFTDEKAPYDPIGATGSQLGHNPGLHNPYGRYFTASASYKFW
ncbi:TonB-dependent receptor plug domain-containing protein [Roseateles sp. DC23W]|uniref:TonB-dependent receptor plug domain-containing protein n=1 Tax=Pelomonas dachongensis TaxID=3299029 RepID=A0ABW7EPP9_9BURK